ncbi:MAG: FKBP-type peptidyl-prolyl cis-trans isomerase [Verrucomicrobiota bacterium]
MKILPLTTLLTAVAIIAAPILSHSQQPSMPEVPEDVAAPPADAAKTDSGLASKVLQAGTGEKKPVAEDTVTVHYSGWTTDGEMFDSSVKRGEPTSFPLGRVIAGWTEGLQLMVVGEKRRFWIPEDLAYGPKVEGSGRPGGMLVFDVELLGIKEAPKPPEGTEKTKGGVAYKIVKDGEGESPGPDQIVTFHFTGKTMEGQLVQDSRSSGEPPTVPLDKLPPELSELFTQMSTGEQRTCWLPDSRMPGGFIVADIELVSFKDAPPPPTVPDDVAAAPKDAEKTDSGLAHKLVSAGEGKEKPASTDTVKVHYSGWTPDGEMFDSSVVRGEPSEFPLNGVIKGWTEGLQLMVVGEKRRFWIPADLAYGENPGGGRPGGMLVFDVELLEIVQ